MSPDDTQDVIGQALSQQAAPAQEAGRDYEAEIAKLRQEAANWRTQFRDAQKVVSELQPVAEQYEQAKAAEKSEAEKLAEKLANLELQLANTKAEAEKAQRVNRLMALAVKAGVPAEVVKFLDASQFDIDDEEATLKSLALLAPQSKPTSGAPANPARKTGDGVQIGEDAIRAWIHGSGGSSIFGD